MLDTPTDVVRVAVDENGQLFVNELAIANDDELLAAMKVVASWSPPPLLLIQPGPETNSVQFVGHVMYCAIHHGFEGKVKMCDESDKP
jgi:hypothetical protein